MPRKRRKKRSTKRRKPTRKTKRKTKKRKRSRRKRSFPKNPKKGLRKTISVRGRRVTFEATGKKGFGAWRIVSSK